MSVATEFSPTVFSDLSSQAGSRPDARAVSVAARRRVRLVPPAPPCPSIAGVAAGVRHGNLRVVRRGRRVPVATGWAAAERVGAAGPRPVRLTRSGTVVIAVAVALLGGLMLLVAHLSVGSPAGRAPVVPGAAVTVRPGDTLWSIAGEVAPGRDPRQVVQRLREVNHLSTVALTPGQTLKVG